MVSDVSACVAAQNCGSSSSSNLEIFSILFRISSGSKSVEKYGTALVDARIERRRIGSDIVVARWNRCARIDRLELYCARFSSRMYSVYIWCCLFTENTTECLLFYAIDVIKPIVIRHNFWFDNTIGCINLWLRCRRRKGLIVCCQVDRLFIHKTWYILWFFCAQMHSCS